MPSTTTGDNFLRHKPGKLPLKLSYMIASPISKEVQDSTFAKRMTQKKGLTLSAKFFSPSSTLTRPSKILVCHSVVGCIISPQVTTSCVGKAVVHCCISNAAIRFEGPKSGL